VQRRDAGSGMGVHEEHGDRIAQVHTEPVEAVRSDTVPPAWVMAEKRYYSPFGALSMYFGGFGRLLEAFGVFFEFFESPFARILRHLYWSALRSLALQAFYLGRSGPAGRCLKRLALGDVSAWSMLTDFFSCP
jgi:hypothetical protein